MAQQVPVDASALAAGEKHDGVRDVNPDLAFRWLLIANIAMYGKPGGPWVLIDAAVMGTAPLIIDIAEARFGKGTCPEAIILTHGHFDHVGALPRLAERWDVPIYAHELERPYLDGSSSYPPPDPTVGGGLMAMVAGYYPSGPTDVSRWLKPLPADGSVPGMPGWRWLHTPGHTPGHVSLWREADRALIAGDAFITTSQESAYAVLTQSREVHGPPMYYTQDWGAARESVRKLAALAPEVVITGHGPPLKGPEMRAALETLARDFDTVAVPKQGRYVNEPARADETGTKYVPPEPR